jgi:putative transposase
LALVSFEEKWNDQYPQIAKSWYNNWNNLMIFLGYPEAIRKLIYTTNSVESVNCQLRKVTNNKRVFPSDNAVFKSLYLTIDYMTQKWTISIQNWNEAMAHLMIKFENRINNI